ncbi:MULTISPECIES: DEAD/DEAH box helicase [Actinosynnema]|uniref:DEAD/DEAH box helicase n=1 Tax=Actinosynnema TaxID=40566 RepID=UPI0020A4B451|nr:DEAD/DEAH box helicase [Actinosynnema pretiosum]MCP2092480.1 Helicase conserved C-terminal domain-containing protein [Actinosynnema pretiosum]
MVGRDTSVAGVVQARWGVRPEPAIARYAEPGWQLSPLPVEKSCPTCGGELHGLYRAHPSGGKQQLQAAVACPGCPATFTLRELKLAQRAVVGELKPEAVARRMAEDAQLASLALEVDERPVEPVEPERPRFVRAADAPELPGPWDVEPANPWADEPPEREPEPRGFAPRRTVEPPPEPEYPLDLGYPVERPAPREEPPRAAPTPEPKPRYTRPSQRAGAEQDTPVARPRTRRPLKFERKSRLRPDDFARPAGDAPAAGSTPAERADANPFAEAAPAGRASVEQAFGGQDPAGQDSAEQARAERGHAEQAHAGPTPAEPTPVNPTPVDPVLAEQAPTEPGWGGRTRPETALVEPSQREDVEESAPTPLASDTAEPSARTSPADPARHPGPADPARRPAPVVPTTRPEPVEPSPHPTPSGPVLGPQPAPARRTATAVVAARIRAILATTPVPTAAAEEFPALPHHLLADAGTVPVWWCKTTDPTLKPPPAPPGADLRVLLPAHPDFADLRTLLQSEGVPFRELPHWLEQETVTSLDAPLRATAHLSEVGGVVAEACEPVAEDAALAARLAFQVVWDLHEPPGPTPPPAPTADLVPEHWLPYLPFPVLNPAQAQAAPAIVGSDEHLLVTAPTGAGKTTIGMLAVLKAILDEGRKAAWLVPQRSLTDELDRELRAWRGQGLRVERLSGEHAVDVERVRAADLWVATTEKFEAVCRAASLQAALGEVGCLVVDEIHLLGSPGRGALLEALLARVRGADSPVRIVGLSATVTNAAEVAEWLQARMVATAWRPSKVTWQLPTVPATSGFAAASRVREQVAVDLVGRHTADGGSVLVFCGSKRNVLSTAMAVAAERGAELPAPDDLDALEAACAAVGVRMHYSDYEHKHAAERAFRARESDVLVATSTVAAGVNLPARAVVVRDSSIGGEPMDTSTVLQMFGRAGRIGAGETEGWSYLVVDESQRAAWQARLVAGYSVYSRIRESLADHVLAEVLQGRVTTEADARAWWVQTLAHAQGDDDESVVVEAVGFLVEQGYLTRSGDALATTELGRLTARMMVPTSTGQRLRSALALLPVPTDADDAEDALGLVLSVAVPELAGVAVPERVRPAVATAVKARGVTSRLTGATSVRGLGSSATTAPGDLAWAALLLVARSPSAFAGARRAVAGIPLSTLHQVLEQAPRYLSWLAAQGVHGTVHPWIAVVAADLDQRVRWRALGPGRGAGRLLWLCERMATRQRARELVPGLWRSATARGVRSPDWRAGRPPAGCELDRVGYTALLRERVTGAELVDGPEAARVACTAGAVAITWRGGETGPPVLTGGTRELAYPEPVGSGEAGGGAASGGTGVGAANGEAGAGAASGGAGVGAAVGVAVFTRRGDYRATGWLAAYDALAAGEEAPAPEPTPRRRGLGMV